MIARALASTCERLDRARKGRDKSSGTSFHNAPHSTTLHLPWPRNGGGRSRHPGRRRTPGKRPHRDALLPSAATANGLAVALGSSAARPLHEATAPHTRGPPPHAASPARNDPRTRSSRASSVVQPSPFFQRMCSHVATGNSSNTRPIVRRSATLAVGAVFLTCSARLE